MVEIPAYITKDGPEPVRVGEIPRFYKGLIEQQDACEGLVVEAVIEGSYKSIAGIYFKPHNSICKCGKRNFR